MHKVSKNNLMIEEFVGNEMTLKVTLLICDPILKFDILKVSYLTHPKERFWLSMISIRYNVTLFTSANLCCKPALCQ
jgi:hypothetical protein